jgi:hypothetical protein
MYSDLNGVELPSPKSRSNGHDKKSNVDSSTIQLDLLL